MSLENALRLYDVSFNDPDSNEVVAYHGTSQLVLDKIIELGINPGARTGDEFNWRTGDVFVVPIKSRIVFNSVPDMYEIEEAFSHATDYASEISMHHYISQKLSLDPFCRYEDCAFNLMSFLRGDYDQQLPAGITADMIHNLERKAPLGFILGYTVDVLKCNPLAGTEGIDMRILRPSIDCIYSIAALCDDSEKYLDNLANLSSDVNLGQQRILNQGH